MDRNRNPSVFRRRYRGIVYKTKEAIFNRRFRTFRRNSFKDFSPPQSDSLSTGNQLPGKPGETGIAYRVQSSVAAKTHMLAVKSIFHSVSFSNGRIQRVPVKLHNVYDRSTAIALNPVSPEYRTKCIQNACQTFIRIIYIYTFL